MKQKIGRYLQLTKPKVTLLNLLVGVTCFVLAAFPAITWLKLALFTVVGYLAAGGCGVLNSFYDRDIDKLMPRTSKRAIPAGQVPPSKALVLGAVMVCASTVLSYFLFNPFTTLMIGLGAAFYLIIYTVWLKRASPWNVVIGGLAGCFAGLAGWTAAVNTLSLIPLLIAMVDFLWTPGHLWALAIKKVKEYQKVGVPMLPVTAGVKRASRVVFLMNIVTVASSLLFPLFNLAGLVYLAVALPAGAVFIVLSTGLLALPSETQGFKVFLASMPYLMCLMMGLIVDKLVFVCI